MTQVAGVDIGAASAHVVVLDGELNVVSAAIWPTSEVATLRDRLADCDCAAIDSPDRWSTGAIPEHAALSPKFVAARCAEYELARTYGYWVPWVTPMKPNLPADESKYEWMARGMELFALLAGRTDAIEVYPNSIFRRLAGPTKIAKKSTAAGLTARVALLRQAGVKAPHLEMWSHDSLDAAAAAIVALHRFEGSAVRVSCDHDGSAMWLPSPTG